MLVEMKLDPMSKIFENHFIILVYLNKIIYINNE